MPEKSLEQEEKELKERLKIIEEKKKNTPKEIAKQIGEFEIKLKDIKKDIEKINEKIKVFEGWTPMQEGFEGKFQKELEDIKTDLMANMAKVEGGLRKEINQAIEANDKRYKKSYIGGKQDMTILGDAEL